MTGEDAGKIDRARNLLRDAGLFYYDSKEELDEGESLEWLQTLNQNDTWGWATAFAQYVPDEQLPRLKDLFFRYGYCGVLYWVSERNNKMTSEFEDINRFVDFVRNEERLRGEEPSSTKRAYRKVEYTIGNRDGTP